MGYLPKRRDFFCVIGCKLLLLISFVGFTNNFCPNLTRIGVCPIYCGNAFIRNYINNWCHILLGFLVCVVFRSMSLLFPLIRLLFPNFSHFFIETFIFNWRFSASDVDNHITFKTGVRFWYWNTEYKWNRTIARKICYQMIMKALRLQRNRIWQRRDAYTFSVSISPKW